MPSDLCFRAARGRRGPLLGALAALGIGSLPWLAGHALAQGVSAPPVSGPPARAVEAFGPDAAAADAQAKRIVAAYEDWIARWGISEASLAVVRDGKVVRTFGFGGRKASTPVLQASLSKAITAICVTKLVDAGKLAFKDTIGDALAHYFATFGPPADRGALKITLGQLVTHSSGITDDATQGSGLSGLSVKKANLGQQLARGLDAPLGSPPGTQFFYNNINYVALGLAIEEASGEDYESACKAAVMAPLGIDKAGLSKAVKIFSSYGGWVISAEDYAKVLTNFYPSLKKLGLPVSKWPIFDLGGGAFYGLGTLFRQSATPGAYNFWHDGALTWFDPPVSVGSYFAIWTSSIGAVTNFSPRPSGSAYADLDRSLYGAAFP